MKGKDFICWGLLLLLWGCSQAEKDKGIKQMIGTMARQELAFADVSYMVENGVVTLSGNVPSEKQMAKVEEKVRNVAGVKGVLNLMRIAPVELDKDLPLQQSVDSVLMKYPTVVGKVQDSVIAVQGSLDSKKAQKLFSSLQQLKPKSISNLLVIQDGK